MRKRRVKVRLDIPYVEMYNQFECYKFIYAVADYMTRMQGFSLWLEHKADSA